MEATGLPQGRELEILEQYRGRLPESVFTVPPANPVYTDYLSARENLRQAVALLKEAGYDFVDGKMTDLKTGRPLSFEILSNSANGSSFTRVMLPFLKNLEKIGIKATFRNLEVNVFKTGLTILTSTSPSSPSPSAGCLATNRKSSGAAPAPGSAAAST